MVAHADTIYLYEADIPREDHSCRTKGCRGNTLPHKVDVRLFIWDEKVSSRKHTATWWKYVSKRNHSSRTKRCHDGHLTCHMLGTCMPSSEPRCLLFVLDECKCNMRVADRTCIHLGSKVRCAICHGCEFHMTSRTIICLPQIDFHWIHKMSLVRTLHDKPMSVFWENEQWVVGQNGQQLGVRRLS
jgi:hypothetical protein